MTDDNQNQTPEERAVADQEVDPMAESVKKGVMDGLAEHDRQQTNPPETDWYQASARQKAAQDAKVRAGQARGGIAAMYPNSPSLWPKPDKDEGGQE